MPRPLAGYGGRRPDAPTWFTEAMAAPCEQHAVKVDGVDIETIVWGSPNHPPLLLLHGSMAHARWWNAVAPLLALEHRVVAMSFSGMGGSGWRPRYAIAQMAREAMAVAEAEHLFDHEQPPIQIAHSFGGKAAALVAGRYGDRFGGTVFVDSFIVPQMIDDAPPYKTRYYDSEADALARFRLSPDQPTGEPYIVDTIARAAIVQRDGRWTWRFDPDFFKQLDFETAWDEAVAARCPLAFVRGEHSTIVTPEQFAMQREHMRSDSVFVEIPNAHHHIMVDQPLALTSALKAIIAGWRSAPR